MTCLPALAAPACNATATWRDTITVVADGAGSWVAPSVYLAPSGVLLAKTNVSCALQPTGSPATVSCALPFLLPTAATAPVLTQLWVAHTGTGGVPQRLNTTIVLIPPPQVAVANGGSSGLAPLTPGGGRIVLRLPAPRLTADDWTAAGLQPLAQVTIDNVTVWLAGAPCTEPAWESPVTLSCAIPVADGIDLPVVVLLAGLFNVTGVLPSLFTPPALMASSTDVTLQTPGASIVNITLTGASLCVNQRARLSTAYVGGLRCATVSCIAGRPDAALCIGWNVTAAIAQGLLSSGSPTLLLNASGVWANRAIPLVACDACVTLAIRPVLMSIIPTSIAAPGVPVVITCTGMMDSTRALPTVLIGGQVCSGITILTTTIIQCNAPSLQSSAPGYPVVSVVVINAAGATSTELVNLTYPATFAVSWSSTPILTALPSGLLTPAPTLQVQSRDAATCSLAINVTSCATTNLALASRPVGMTVSSTTTTTLAVGASGTPNAVLTDLLLNGLEASGGSGCIGTLTASCIDAVGQTASTAGQTGPAVVLAAWRADWNASNLPAAPFVVVPEALPQLAAIFSLSGSNSSLNTTDAASLSCQALLLPAAATPPPLTQSLDRVSSRDVLSSVTGTVALVNSSAAGIAFAGLTASAARLGQALAIYAECTWVPTGERVRLPTLFLAIANVSLALVPSTAILVEAYESASIAAIAVLSPPGVATFAGAGATCTWRAGYASAASLMLAAASSAASWTVNASGTVVGGQPLAATVEGLPGATLVLQLVCALWGGNSVASPPLNITTRDYAVALQAGPSTRTVWPSGAQTVLPWAPAVEVAAPARSVLTCSLSTVSSARGAGLGMSDTTVQVVGDVAVSVVLDSAATCGNASLSRVGLRAPGGSNATLAVACRDGVGRSARLVVPINVSVASLVASWSGATVAAMPTVVVPGQALPALALSVASTPAVALPPDADASSLVTCVAGLFAASTPLPLGTPLASAIASAGPFASASTGGSGATVGVGAGNTSIVVAMAALSTATCPLSAALVVAAECTWVPTGERLRLPSLPLSVANVSLALTPSKSMLVEAYESATVAATATLSPLGVATFAGAAAACTWRAGAATTYSIVLAASTVASSWTLDASGIVGGAQPLSLTVEGPPSATLTLQLVCNLWGGNTVASSPLNVTTANYAVVLRGGGTGTPRVAWPSGTQAVLPLAPALDVAAPARSVLTCSADVAGVVLPSPAYMPGVGLGLADTAVQLIGEPSVSVSLTTSATRADVSLPRMGLRAPSGTNASLGLTCRDGVGRSAALGVPINVSVAALSASWSAGTVVNVPAVVVPTQSLPSFSLTLASTPAVPLPPNVDVGSLATCTAALVRATMALPLGTPLGTLLAAASPYASVSTSSVVLGAGNTSIVITLQSLSTAACPLSTLLMVVAECTWTPTGERVRLPTLATATLPLSASWVTPPTSVLGYSAVPLHIVATLAAPASAGATTSAHCEVMLLNATARGVSVLADAWVMEVDASAPAGTAIPTSVNVTLQAPPGAAVYVQASCEVWGQVLATPPLRLAVASLTLQLLSGLPDSFIASDASSPWPLDPLLSLRVVTNDGAAVTDVSCAVSTSTPGAEFKVVGSTASLQSVAAHATTGVVDVPPFVVQTPTTMDAVNVTVECRRSSGDAPPPLVFTVPAVRLHAELCAQPATQSFVGTALPEFAVGIVAVTANGSVFNPCGATAPTTVLPSIVCSIELNASATTTNDTASTFLQHTLTTVAAATHRATFDAFTVVAPQGESYGLIVTCAVGGLAITPALLFTVTLDGCSIGQESVSVSCVTCGGTSFSFGGIGARCTGCPPIGATCNAGILTLLPHYFRPAAQAGQPLGPGTELHPCYNAEACTLEYSGNSSGTAVYGCAYGNTGPLCGVCDAAVNYARFGEACAICWDAGASWLFLIVVMTLVLAVLTRVALRKESGRSDASIVLRITLGFLQAVGSLRVFRAGSTKAYDSVMGWTEVVSASPLSVGALQCILRLPYLLQYVTTILLPVLASAAVVVIFLGITTGRSVHCKPRFSMDMSAVKAAVAAWWASKRHLSTLLFVLFLAYMPIVSASLRALDCIKPVAGVRYLRSDLRVECGVGQHAAARGLAYTVLIALGIGFPTGLAWLLGTARNEQLVDPAFHATWGFLFDGYRAPTRTLTGGTPMPASGDASNKLDGTGKLFGAPAKPAANVPSPGAVGGDPPAAVRGGRRRSSLMPERLTQTWVVSGDSRVWWEAVVLARKAGVVLLAVTLTNPYLQCVGATLWFFAAYVLQTRYSPYTKPLFNRLETVSLVTTLLTAVISTALLQYNVGVTSAELHAPDAMTGIEWAVTILLAVMNVGTFAVFAILWLRLQCVRARGIMRRASVITALTGRVAGMRASFARRRSSAVVQSKAPPTPAKLLLSSAVSSVALPATTENPLHVRATPVATQAAAMESPAALLTAHPHAVGCAAPPGSGVGESATTLVADAPSAAASRHHLIGVAAPPPVPAPSGPGRAEDDVKHAAPQPAAVANRTRAATGDSAEPAPAASLHERGVAFAATPVFRVRRRA